MSVTAEMGTGSSVRSLIQFILLVSIPVVLSSKFVNISRIIKFSHNPHCSSAVGKPILCFHSWSPVRPGVMPRRVVQAGARIVRKPTPAYNPSGESLGKPENINAEEARNYRATSMFI